MPENFFPHDRSLGRVEGQQCEPEEGECNRYAGLSEYELRHLPAHLRILKYWDLLERLLTSLAFVEAKTGAGMVDGLLRDYEETRFAFATRWDEELPIAEFARFLSHEAHFLREAPETLYQQAINTDDGPIRDAALRSAVGFVRPWLRKTAGNNRPHHSGSVISIAFWGNDRFLAVSTTQREVWVWDLVRRSLWRRCETPPSAAKSLAVSPDGEFLAAGFGAAEPTPFVSGAIVWNWDGRAHRLYKSGDWIYHVRWRSNDQLVLAGGLPTGSEAGGTLWEANLSGEACDEIGCHLAARPLVLTWDPVSGCRDQIMMLSMDGVVCHLTPDYVPITDEKISKIFSQVYAEGNNDPDIVHARMIEFDDRIAALRPVVANVCSPCSGTFGFYQAAQILRQNTICILGEPPVPAEMLIFHESVPDGIYLYDFDQGAGGGVRFKPEALKAGFRAICLAAEPGDTGGVVVGTAHGEALRFPLRPDGGRVEQLHQGNYSITGMCFSESGKLFAVGGNDGQIAVYDRMEQNVVFETRTAEAPLAARVAGPVILLLYRDRLASVALQTGAKVGDILLPEEHVGIDFDRQDNLAIVLSGRRGRKSSVPEYSIHLIDLAAQRLLLSASIPGHVPAPAGSSVADKPDFLDRVRLRVSDNSIGLLVGSVRGLMEYQMLAFGGGRSFVLPFEPEKARQQRSHITVLRSFDTPEISCESIAVTPDGAAVFCGYADNQDHPRVSGELRVWDGTTVVVSEGQRFTGKIVALDATAEGIVIVGTDDCEAGSWRLDEGWQQLAKVEHRVAVVAVACAEERGLACSASRDGLLMVWLYRDGTILLRTFVDVEPMFVGFVAGGRGLCMVDRNGEVHAWEIENFDHNQVEPDVQPVTPRRTSEVIKQCLTAAAYLNRVNELAQHGDQQPAIALLNALPEVPDRESVLFHWRARLADDSSQAR